MDARGARYVYGPVPSRRLGRSLGIDLVPFKTCTYDCTYCQLGRTTHKTLERREYVPIGEVLRELERQLDGGDRPDYIGIAGSGEPTLHRDIGGLIRAIKELTRIPVAVLTNGSLLWMAEVRDALMAADVVCPSLDAGDARLFEFVNRPHASLAFPLMVDGLAAFARRFPGEVWLEVLLLAGVTGQVAEASKIAALAERIGPTRVQLNTVMRPPAESSALPLALEELEALCRYFPKPVDIIGARGLEGTAPAASPTAGRDAILALLGRRPCTAQDVATGLGLHVTEALKQLQELLAANAVSTVLTGERRFYTAVDRSNAAEASARE